MNLVGESLEALEENLLDIYTELTSGTIPCVRKVAVCSPQYIA